MVVQWAADLGEDSPDNMLHSHSSPALLAERSLTFSPTLAQTIGLEPAVLLQALGEISVHHHAQRQRGYDWFSIPWDAMSRFMPFWTPTQLLNVAYRLQEQGLIALVPAQDRNFVFALTNTSPSAIAEPSPTPAPARGNRAATSPAIAKPLSDDWMPGNDILRLLSLEHRVTQEFALAQLEDFKLYWQSQGGAYYDWDNKFRKHVLNRWQTHRQQQQEHFMRQQVPFDKHWQPNEDALEILQRNGIPTDFIEQAIPEFVLYWRERKQPDSPNARFVARVQRQWALFTQVMSNESEPRQITPDWQPRAEVYDILKLAYIDPDFARSQIPEFILYWTERGDVQTSWSTRFVQHVKYAWSHRHKMTGQSHERQQADHQSGHTRSRGLDAELADRSWAQTP